MMTQARSIFAHGLPQARAANYNRPYAANRIRSLPSSFIL